MAIPTPPMIYLNISTWEKGGEPMRGNKEKYFVKDTRNPHKIKGFR